MNGRRPAGTGADRGSHHISSVAHHFLEQERAASVAGPEARCILVGAASDGRAAAFAAAGLLTALGGGGAGLPDRQGRGTGLFLFESDNSRWSATAYLDRARCGAAPDQDTPDSIPAGWSDAAWRVGAASDETNDGRVNAIHVCQLGAVPESLLEWFELRRVVRAGGARPGFVWCLDRREALQLARAQALGRLLSALEPDPIEILVFPDEWQSSGRGGVLDRVRRLAGRGRAPASQLAAEAEDLFRCLLPRGDVNVSLLEPREGAPLAGAAAEVLERAARRLAADVPSG